MRNKKIAIVHYTYPPVIGGVEIIIQAHARILTRNAHQVKIISGEGEKEEGIEVKTIPCLKSLAIFDQELDKRLKKGEVPHRFYNLKKEIFSRVEKELTDIDICIIHNIMTMHFNLPLTCALNELIEKLHSQIKFYLWCHDSTLTNPIYQKDIPCPDHYPWNLLSRFNPQVEYIAISKVRRRELAKLFSVDTGLIQVIPAGVDVKSFLNISDSIWNLAQDKGFFESDLVMFFPSRMLQRKNYELGIKVLKEMKKRGKKSKFVITAPPDPHNPVAARYFNYLHQLSRKLGVEEEVIFLFDLKEHYGLKLDYKEMKDLYSVCDVLFITSTQEGFGIPLLEAGIKRMPIICSNIEPLSEVVQGYALKIDLEQDIPTITEEILNYVQSLSTLSMFKRAVFSYSWEAIYKNYLKKLVNKNAKDWRR
jgi:glycosyltransferase involved in cell wall biosynthesis